MTNRKLQIGLGIVFLMLSACGHRVPPAPQSPAGASAPALFVATAYCTRGITASGVTVSRGIVAADPAVLPVGSLIRLSGAASYDGMYRVLDTGAFIRKQRLDLFIPDCSAARKFGRRPVRVTLVGRAR